MDYQIIPTQPGDALWHYVAAYSSQTIGYIDDQHDGGRYHCFLAIGTDDAFIGLCIIDIGPMRIGPLAAETVGFLENILVLPPYRRRGIGAALLHTVLKLAWEEGARHVRWTVDYEGDGLPFYRKLGCAFIPEEDPQSESPERYYTVVAVNPQEILYASV